VVEAVERERVTRRNLLRDLALTLSHEVGNALVSLSVFRQLGADRPLPAAMVDTLKRDVANLEALNANLALLNTLYEAAPTPFDVREMVESLGNSLGLRTELGQVSVVLAASRPLLEFALRSLLRSVGENRGELGLKELVLRLRVAGTGDALTVLLALRGPRMELEGDPAGTRGGRATDPRASGRSSGQGNSAGAPRGDPTRAPAWRARRFRFPCANCEHDPRRCRDSLGRGGAVGAHAHADWFTHAAAGWTRLGGCGIGLGFSGRDSAAGAFCVAGVV
jgi:hypothetical protein